MSTGRPLKNHNLIQVKSANKRKKMRSIHIQHSVSSGKNSDGSKSPQSPKMGKKKLKELDNRDEEILKYKRIIKKLRMENEVLKERLSKYESLSDEQSSDSFDLNFTLDVKRSGGSLRNKRKSTIIKTSKSGTSIRKSYGYQLGKQLKGRGSNEITADSSDHKSESGSKKGKSKKSRESKEKKTEKEKRAEKKEARKAKRRSKYMSKQLAKQNSVVNVRSSRKDSLMHNRSTSAFSLPSFDENEVGSPQFFGIPLKSLQLNREGVPEFLVSIIGEIVKRGITQEGFSVF
eukprot:TRINITY_DN10493_c0_g1_i2.p1 TRINITY_DN10493_c0_g1~~TRINITY_DN10493_c0_g1_i2.p1  ORF type:complete len:289 (+),score=72.27 TRINITY_DN10493_c0_g1_i2:136-1002(+)